MQSLSLMWTAGTGQLSRYPLPATSSPALGATSSPTSRNRCSSGCLGTAYGMLPRSRTHWILAAPTPSLTLPGSGVTDICAPSGPRLRRGSLHTARAAPLQCPVLLRYSFPTLSLWFKASPSRHPPPPFLCSNRTSSRGWAHLIVRVGVAMRHPLRSGQPGRTLASGTPRLGLR